MEKLTSPTERIVTSVSKRNCRSWARGTEFKQNFTEKDMKFVLHIEEGSGPLAGKRFETQEEYRQYMNALILHKLRYQQEVRIPSHALCGENHLPYFE